MKQTKNEVGIGRSRPRRWKLYHAAGVGVIILAVAACAEQRRIPFAGPAGTNAPSAVADALADRPPLTIRAVGGDCFEFYILTSTRSLYRVERTDDLITWSEERVLPSTPYTNTVPVRWEKTELGGSVAAVSWYAVDRDTTAAVTWTSCATDVRQRFWRVRQQSLDEPLDLIPCPYGTNEWAWRMVVARLVTETNKAEVIYRCNAGHMWRGTNTVTVGTNGTVEIQWP